MIAAGNRSYLIHLNLLNISSGTLLKYENRNKGESFFSNVFSILQNVLRVTFPFSKNEKIYGQFFIIN